MELKCFRTLWGVTTPWPQTLDELQRVGCCGIEARVPLTVAERRQLPPPPHAPGGGVIAPLL
ncbi:xylose isomerase, partial [Klebsiella pneumoniae]